ncbi:FAU ubiquitin-like and ribosomal protein S30 [Condylostylus longicornis]|uniref:FAU ubiquitin-like and ribosomal protein S30 n=1 Tax=Condylostylus longicornis TaxID=2530218 RepID=UPI00244E4432|nr:FAU ubiquitin-like and ribosomal protein S30 [Condylostylus longicornis]
MQIFVRGLENIETFEVSKEDTVQVIKLQVSQKYGVNCDEISLHSEGNILDNNVQIGELSSCELDVTVPLLGGKVHGSLARAGKVKGQTPKVDKQEKKKKKTGRAKRRIQYNRRFVNVVAAFGRRRGPNARSS